MTTRPRFLLVPAIEDDENRNPQAEPPSNVPSEVFDLLEKLCRWAGTEGETNTVGELLDTAREPGRLPPDLERLWGRAARSAISSTRRVDPLSAILDWYRSLDRRRRVILSTRTLVLSGVRTLKDIASEFDVSRERIRQVEARLIEHLGRLPETTAREAVFWRVHRVRRVAGAAFPVGDEPTEALLASNEVRSHGEDVAIRGVILRLAGPYQLVDGWFISDPEKLEAARHQLVEEARKAGSVEFDTVREVMTAAGLHPRLVAEWLSQRSGMRGVRSRVIEWPRSLRGRVQSLMRSHGSPMAPDELLAKLGSEVKIRSLRTALSSGEQFVRVGLSKWGLSSWGLPEYEGIATTISEELSARGPSLSVSELATRLSAAWGVSESSVVAICNAPRFVVDQGVVRHRRADEAFQVSTDLSQACGVFKPSDNEVSVLVDVDQDLLRGSGRSVAEQVAGLLALRPGENRDYEAGRGVVRLSWPDTSVTGPALGSLRVHAEELNAVVGDRLRITFRGGTLSADVRLVAKTRVEELVGDLLLTEVTGLTGQGQELLARLAVAVESDSSELARFLRRRGDEELADHLPTPDTSSALEEQIDKLAGLLEA